MPNSDPRDRFVYPYLTLMSDSCNTVLDARLDKRVDGMLSQGLVKELTDFHTQYNADRLKEGRYGGQQLVYSILH